MANIVKGQIGNALESVAPDGIVATADAIFDETKNKSQDQINEEVDQGLSAQYHNTGYYECGTEAATAAKTISTGSYSYRLPSTPPYGGSIKVKFTYKNSAANPTLSINLSDPKPLYYNGAIASSTNTWADGDVLDLYYDGTNFNATSVVEKFATGEKVKEVGIDSTPTAGSDNLVKSGGVQNELALGAVYDVSAKNPTAGPNNDGKFESLSALLSDANLSTLIPTSVRKGGMSIKFVQSSDNKYVQFRCMAQNFTTDVTQWQGVDDEPTAGSNNLVKSGGTLKTIQKATGIYSASHELVIGQAIGINDFKLLVDIKAGEQFKVKLTTTGSFDPPLFRVIYKGDVSVTIIQRISIDTEYTFTAERDIEVASVYIGANDIHTAGNFNLSIKSPNGIIPKLDALEQTTDALQEDVDNIASSINNIGVIEVFPNLFDKSNVILNKYYQGDNSTPTLVTNTNFACQLVELPNDSSQYIMNYKDYQVDAYNSDKQRISGVYFTAGVAHSVPQGTKYLTISLQKTHLASYMLVEGETLPESYAEFGTYLKNGLYTPKPKIYHVGIRITREDYYEYQNLTALLKSLKDDDSEKIIYIHGGTYDIFEEYGGADYISTLSGNESWSDVSVFVPKNTKIIGLGKVILSFTPTDAQIVNSHNAQLFSPLNVTGNCHIENIEIVGQNCRYCIHDEITAGVSENSRHIYKNVKMTKLQGIDGNPQAFGCGFGDGMYYEFDGCDICSYTIAFSMHNTDTTISKNRSVIIIKNSHIHSSGVTDTPIVFRNSSTIQVEHLVNIYNTYIKGSENYVILKIENPSGNVNAVNCFNVSLFGCNQITPSIVGISTENLYEVKQFNNAGWVFYNKKLVFNNDGSVTWVTN